MPPESGDYAEFLLPLLPQLSRCQSLLTDDADLSSADVESWQFAGAVLSVSTG